VERKSRQKTRTPPEGNIQRNQSFAGEPTITDFGGIVKIRPEESYKTGKDI